MTIERKGQSVNQEVLKRKPDLVIVVNHFSRRADEKYAEVSALTLKHGINHTIIGCFKPSDQVQDVIPHILDTHQNPLIAVIGGDGTCSNAVNGYVNYSGNKDDACFLFVPAGSGNDTSHDLGHYRKRTIEKALCGDFEIKHVDALKMTTTSADGSQRTCYGIAHLGFAISAVGAKRINERRPGLIGQAGIALGAILNSEGIDVNIGGRSESYGEILIVNGRQVGKILHARDTDIADGKFDLFFFENEPSALLRKTIKAVTVAEKGIQREKIEFTVLKEVTPHIDGEQIEPILPGSLVQISVLKKAIPVVKTSR